MQPRRAPLDPDTRLLAGLTTWEQLFGQKPLSWVELHDLGFGLTPEEAGAYLGRGLGDSLRGAAYQVLLEHHPELRDVLDPKVQRWVGDAAARVCDAVEVARSEKRVAGAPHDFVAKLSADVEPHPDKELAHLMHQAAQSPDRC